MSETTRARPGFGFALGNIVPALVLCVSGYALPVRYLVADTFVVLTVAVVLGASGWALFRPDRAVSALRIAALALFSFGLVVIAAAALGVAYLHGVQGDFGRGGVLIMVLVLLLALPYLVAYPVIELLWLGRQKQRAAEAEGPVHEP